MILLSENGGLCLFYPLCSFCCVESLSAFTHFCATMLVAVSIHSFSAPTSPALRVAAASTSCLWEKAVSHPEQVSTLSQGHRERQSNIDPHTHSYGINYFSGEINSSSTHLKKEFSIESLLHCAVIAAA